MYFAQVQLRARCRDMAIASGDPAPTHLLRRRSSPVNLPSMIRLEHVSKSFGPSLALSSFDLAVGAGQSVVLIGPSGSGKSTVLRLMIGLIPPDSGHVYFRGE